jgi:murein DD-endopeptidase MepM/ murein hydrolase activator NlpD
VPKAGTGVLSWPLAKRYRLLSISAIRLLQQKIRKATAGKGHNGIDLRAAVGTKVFAPADGIVAGVGDTGFNSRLLFIWSLGHD